LHASIIHYKKDQPTPNSKSAYLSADDFRGFNGNGTEKGRSTTELNTVRSFSIARFHCKKEPTHAKFQKVYTFSLHTAQLLNCRSSPFSAMAIETASHRQIPKVYTNLAQITEHCF